MDLASRWRRWILSALLPTLAGLNSCITVNYTLKPDTLQSGDVVIVGRWERFNRKGYQAAEKTGWGSHCVGDVERPEGGRMFMQLGYYPDDLWALRMPSPVQSPIGIAVECTKIVATTESATPVRDGQELGLYRNEFLADKIYVMPPMRMEYRSDAIRPHKVEQDDSPAAAKKVLTDMLEFWPEFAEREMLVLESSDEEDY